MASAGSSGVGRASCGACKFLRRKCERGCLHAPYFSPEEGATDFAAIHKVFGASKMGKFLRRVQEEDRGNVARSIAYEAHARLSDPVFGCVRQISALQQQVASLEAQLMQAKAQLANISSVNQLRQPRPWSRHHQQQQDEESNADPSDLHSFSSYKQTVPVPPESSSLDHTTQSVGLASPTKADENEPRSSELHYQPLPLESSLDHTNHQDVVEEGVPCHEALSSAETNKTIPTKLITECNDLDKWIEYFFLLYRDDLLLEL